MRRRKGTDMADEEPVDPFPAIREECKSHCTALSRAYEKCAKATEDNPKLHCSGPFMDLIHCIDHCAAPKVFAKLT